MGVDDEGDAVEVSLTKMRFSPHGPRPPEAGLLSATDLGLSWTGLGGRKSIIS